MARRSTVTRRLAPGSLARRLTAEFYAWERQGRGWDVFSHPVELEPPFSPFPRRRALETAADDGQRPSLLARLAGRTTTAPPTPRPTPEPLPEPFTDGSPIAELQVRVPPGLKVTREAAEGLLVSLPAPSRPLAFEVIGLPDRIVVQVAAGEGDRTGSCDAACGGAGHGKAPVGWGATGGPEAPGSNEQVRCRRPGSPSSPQVQRPIRATLRISASF